MKTKLLAAASLLLMFCSVAAAQDFSIRISKNTNLRSIASLQGRIVETAKAGATLHVIGSQGKWFKISHSSGGVWMANWVSYTRVESPAPATAPVANIDNCCFVDRQCHTEQDWSDGYWAFQNKQCAAPVQSGQPAQQPASSAPASQSPAGVDNCCYLGWQCNTEEEWNRGFHAYQHNQCYSPGISIQGSQTFVDMMQRVLQLLRSGARQWYDYVLNSGLRRIQMNQPGVTGFAPDDFHYGQGFADSDIDGPFYYIAIAGVLAHESCHAHQFKEGRFRYETQWIWEKECVEVQLAVHSLLDPQCRECDWYRDLIRNIENPDWWWW